MPKLQKTIEKETWKPPKIIKRDEFSPFEGQNSIKTAKMTTVSVADLVRPTHALPKSYPSTWQAQTACMGLRSPRRHLARGCLNDAR